MSRLFPFTRLKNIVALQTTLAIADEHVSPGPTIPVKHICRAFDFNRVFWVPRHARKITIQEYNKISATRTYSEALKIMKKTLIATVFTIFFILNGNAYAKGGYALAQKHMCTVCHSLDRKLLGPTWMNISLRYQNQADAEAYLISKIRNGGSGVWGSNVMPPSTQLSDEDIKTLADYVLKLSKE